MFRAVLTSLAITVLASESRAQGSGLPKPLRPVGHPTAWVSAKDLSRISLVEPGVSSSRVISCVNRGSAGGTFAPGTIDDRPGWYDDGALGAGRPYFYFSGPPHVHQNLAGSLVGHAYVNHDAFTIYMVMHPAALHTSGTDPDEPLSPHATPISFVDVGLAVKNTAEGAMAVGASAHWTPQDPAVWDAVEMPIHVGDQKLHVWKLVHSGDVLSLSRDGGVPVSVPCVSTNGLNYAPLIGFNGQNFNNGAFQGAVCEWIIYDRALSAAEDATNMMYLINEWRTPAR